MPRFCRLLHAFALVAAAACHAESPYQLAAKYGCLGCHAPDYAHVGPSFQQIAERYAHRSDAIEVLVLSARRGSATVWGETPMPADLAPESDVQQIVSWILEH